MPKRNRSLIIIFFIIIFFWQASDAFASTYYISSTDGDDTCTGLSQTAYTTGVTACPIKTLTKLNTKTFSPGDNIYFKSGDTFYGTITVLLLSLPMEVERNLLLLDLQMLLPGLI
ncbi:MAG: hypothetical protein US04_C0003G0002 [Candidatus Nomurabacteria bacterium GW2011_GWD2_36_14]|nr:MAG: hypothetical protein US04_C0003G0002 [Candidatus Nomurabacteria bacterium GW2011_GWD2_36_14]